MVAASHILALALATAATPPTATGEIRYEISFLNSRGFNWRGAVFAEMKPIAKHGEVTVWSCSRETMARLLSAASKDTRTSYLQAPRITGEAGKVVHAQSRGNQSFVTRASWTGSEAKLESETVRIGWMATLVGRKIDQGILVRAAFESSDLLGVHHVKASARPSDSAGRGDQARSAFVQLDVPEVATSDVEGEWLVGPDECLAVSFGVHTTAEASGKAVMCEQMLFVRAHEMAAHERLEDARHKAKPAELSMSQPEMKVLEMDAKRLVIRPARTWSPLAGVVNERKMVPPPVPIAAAPVLTPPPSAPLAAPEPPVFLHTSPGAQAAFAPSRGIEPPHAAVPPPAPSRSIPQGVHPDGKLAPLPPLPDEAIDDDDTSSDPRPSPQKHRPDTPEAGHVPAKDLGTSRTGYNQLQPFFPAANPAGQVPVRFQFLLPIKPFSLRLPFDQRLEIEVVGKIVPAPPVEKMETKTEE